MFLHSYAIMPVTGIIDRTPNAFVFRLLVDLVYCLNFYLAATELHGITIYQMSFS